MNVWLAIVNPNAGFHKASIKWERIKHLLKKNDVPFVPVITENSKDVYLKTIEGINKGFRRILVIGGDGTLNEVVNALFLSTVPLKEFIIGMIPVGAGNDWCRMHRISSRTEKAIQVIKKEKLIRHDIGIAKVYVKGDLQFRYFLINAGLGFDATVSERVNRRQHNLITGPLNYIVTALTTLLKYKSHKVTLLIDDDEFQTEGMSINIGICKYKGAGMMLMPYAIPDDGLFDFSLIMTMGRFNAIRSIRKLYDGNVVKLPGIIIRQCETVEIHTDEKLVMETDGETIIGDGPYRFSILAKALYMVVA